MDTVQLMGVREFCSCQEFLSGLLKALSKRETMKFTLTEQCMVKMSCRVVVALVACAFPCMAQQNTAAIKAWVDEHQQTMLAEYLRLVSVPDVHNDVPSLRRNAELLRQMLERRNLHPEIWDTPGAPVVYAERMVPGARRTLLFYIHYDGQPVEPAHWAQPDPFVPVLRDGALESGAQVVTEYKELKTLPADWRVYARAAADDKGPIEAFVSAIDAIDDTHSAAGSNIKLILDGEEEGGGQGLASALKNHGDKLQADVMVLLDGPQHPSRQATIYYGARGGAGLDVTVYTAASALHSGNYGNWMPDANVRLAQLLASMVEPSGRVAIAGFYSDVPPFSAATRAMLKAVPDDSAAMQQRYGVGKLDGAASSLQEGLNLPSFSIHTMQGGEVGGVIAAHASAQIAMRLVAENDAAQMVARVVAHIRSQGYWIVDKDPDTATLASHPMVAKVTSRKPSEPAGGAWRTDPTLPQARFVHDALETAWAGRLVEIRTLGGSVPATPFIETLHVPVVGVSLVNYDDNQHTNNENLRLGNLWDGVQTLAAIMTQP